jgi:hypothetical protein
MHALEEDDEDRENEAYDQIKQDGNLSDEEEKMCYEQNMCYEQEEAPNYIMEEKTYMPPCNTYGKENTYRITTERSQDHAIDSMPCSDYSFKRCAKNDNSSHSYISQIIKHICHGAFIREDDVEDEPVIDSCVVDFLGNRTCEIDADNEVNHESLLNTEEISALLDMEYQKHVEKSGQFFSMHHDKQVDGSVHTQGVLDEEDDKFQESNNGDEIEQHTTYEHEEVSDESSHGDMPEFSISLNPLFEGYFLCNQAHQHHDKDSGPSDHFEDDGTKNMYGEVYSESETCIISSYEKKLYQTCEDVMEPNIHNEENVLMISSKNYPSILSDQILDKKEVPECELSPNPFCEEKQHLEYREDCVHKEIQVEELNLVTGKVDQMHGDLLFSKDYSAPVDFSKGKQNSKCANKAMNVVHENGGIVFGRSKVLHDQNYVFDRGKKQCSFFWGAPKATQFHFASD